MSLVPLTTFSVDSGGAQEVLIPSFPTITPAPPRHCPHHALEYCDETRNIDALLARYSREREKVLNLLADTKDLLIRNLWSLQGPLSFDPRCLKRMGQGDPQGQWIPISFACTQCHIFHRLTDYRLGFVDRPFQIECGREAGVTMILRRIPSIRSSLRVVENKYIAEDAALSYRKYAPYFPSHPNPNTLVHLEVDSYTSGLLISWLLERYMRERGSSNVQRLYNAFVCSDDGYYLTEHLRPLTVESCSVLKIQEDVWSLLVQLVVIGKALQALSFSHPSLSLSNLFIRDTPISYKEEDVHVRSPWTLVIGSLEGGSICTTSLQQRSTPEDERASTVEEELVPTALSIHTTPRPHTGLRSRSSDPQVFHEGDGTPLYSVPDQFRGSPSFSGSYEFYILLLHLMTIPVVRNAVYESSHSRVRSLWNRLWTSKDLEALEIHYNVSRPSYRTTTKNLHLKHNVLEIAWSSVRETHHSM